MDAGQQDIIAQLARFFERARLAPTTEEASVTPFDLNLAELSTTKFTNFREAGYGLYYPAPGNPLAAALEIQGRGVGHVRCFSPGDSLRGFFRELQIKAKPGVPASGVASLLIARSPLAAYGLGEISQVGAYYDSTSYTQQYDRASGAQNAPSSATAGISVAGARRIRASFIVDGYSIATGYGRWWNLIDGTNWLPEGGPPAYTITNDPGGEAWSGPVEDVGIPYGRRFLEVYGFTSAEGDGTPVVTLEVW